MFDMMKMMGKVKEFQAAVKEAQESLEQITVTGESGGGMVKVTANGAKQLIKIDVDQEILNDDDKDLMKDLIIAAANKALADAEIAAKEEIKKKTQGMLPNIPGLDFNQFS